MLKLQLAPDEGQLTQEKPSLNTGRTFSKAYESDLEQYTSCALNSQRTEDQP